jgi:hypothetical protein
MNHKLLVMGSIILIFFAGTASALFFSLNRTEGASGISPVSLHGNHMDRIASTTAPLPEPATMLLLGAGLIGVAVTSRKQLSKK